MTAKPVTPERVAAARRRMNESLGDMPSSEGSGGKGSISRPVERLALHTPDIARRDMVELDRLMALCTQRRLQQLPVTQLEHSIDDLLARWEPLSEWQTERLKGMSADGEPGCTSCHRVGAWSPRHTRAMCKTCDRLHARVQGRYLWDQELPPRPLVELSRTGKRITDTDIDRALVGTPERVE